MLPVTLVISDMPKIVSTRRVLINVRLALLLRKVCQLVGAIDGTRLGGATSLNVDADALWV